MKQHHSHHRKCPKPIYFGPIYVTALLHNQESSFKPFSNNDQVKEAIPIRSKTDLIGNGVSVERMHLWQGLNVLKTALTASASLWLIPHAYIRHQFSGLKALLCVHTKWHSKCSVGQQVISPGHSSKLNNSFKRHETESINGQCVVHSWIHQQPDAGINRRKCQAQDAEGPPTDERPIF